MERDGGTTAVSSVRIGLASPLEPGTGRSPSLHHAQRACDTLKPFSKAAGSRARPNAADLPCAGRKRVFIFSMRHPPEKSQCLAGQLLVAHPSMLDPNFRRSVLFISAHDAEEGAVGVIINRPLDKRVAELVPEEAPEALAEVPVFLGGPVATNQLTFATFDWDGSDVLTLGQSFLPETADALAAEGQPGVRAFVGHAGWGAGQLENELRQHAWLVQKPNRDALAPERLPRLWFEIMRNLGPWFKLLAAAPDDPSLN